MKMQVSELTIFYTGLMFYHREVQNISKCFGCEPKVKIYQPNIKFIDRIANKSTKKIKNQPNRNFINQKWKISTEFKIYQPNIKYINQYCDLSTKSLLYHCIKTPRSASRAPRGIHLCGSPITGRPH